MIGKEIIESEAIPSAKVKEVLEEFSENNELNYEQNLTLNHLSRFKRYSAEDSEEIMEKLQETFPNLRTRAIVHIVDLAPQDLADLRLIFAKEPYQPQKEEMEQILEILEQYDVEE
ncbi:RNA polymerase Rpb4 family protein [Methanobrevibacter sp.]|uniref:RNA polymerase Rpb4 family protein n=1 Tax=Methanobrevibacter sp. TaxID=66852 RepID=UPI002E77F195|nr:RNA polymerase Rpb4 family protein [Methanobrevibacter sp.]MEE0939346.1 RNA polymerase Rpb4 family protein [Methanobrevibacter sp.]